MTIFFTWSSRDAQTFFSI